MQKRNIMRRATTPISINYAILNIIAQCSWLVPGIDACALGHDCQHTCVSSGSSYYCTCPPGFVLMQDKKSCFKASVGADDDGSASELLGVMGHKWWWLVSCLFMTIWYSSSLASYSCKDLTPGFLQFFTHDSLQVWTSVRWDMTVSTIVSAVMAPITANAGGALSWMKTRKIVHVRPCSPRLFI